MLLMSYRDLIAMILEVPRCLLEVPCLMHPRSHWCQRQSANVSVPPYPTVGTPIIKHEASQPRMFAPHLHEIYRGSSNVDSAILHESSCGLLSSESYQDVNRTDTSSSRCKHRMTTLRLLVLLMILGRERSFGCCMSEIWWPMRRSSSQEYAHLPSRKQKYSRFDIGECINSEQHQPEECSPLSGHDLRLDLPSGRRAYPLRNWSWKRLS